MYDYTAEPSERIEQVDHQMEILGIKLIYVPLLAGILLLTALNQGPVLAVVVSAPLVIVFRALYFREERGEPLMFEEHVEAVTRKIPKKARQMLFPVMSRVEFGLAEYRE